MHVLPIRPAGPDRRLVFGRFRFDAASGILDDGGRSVRLRSQVSRLLEFLIQHRDEQLSREQLCEVLWGPDADLGTQTNALDRVLADLRRDLGPQSRSLLRKEGRGHYRFSVDEATQPVEADDTTPLYTPFPTADLIHRKLPARSDVYIYSAHPPELKEAFAWAALANMANRVHYTFFVPSRAAHVIPDLVVSLLLAPGEKPGGSLESLEENLRAVRVGVRIVPTSEISPWLEFIVHNAGGEEPQAYARYPSAQLCARYGEAQLAREIAGRLRQELPAKQPEPGLIWYPPGFRDDAVVSTIKAAQHRHLQTFPAAFGRSTLDELLNLPAAV